MCGVPLDRLDEVGDQVGAAGELDVDATQRLLGPDVGAAEPVEADDAEAHQGQHDDDDDDPDAASALPHVPLSDPCAHRVGHHDPPPPPPPPPPPEKPPPPLLCDWVAW